jgi:hypothetical protein
MPTSPDIRSLIESFTSDLSTVMRRAALEEVQARLTLVIGDVAPKRRGPGRPRATAAAAVPQKKKRGKRTAADLAGVGDALLAHVKANPGARGEQIAAALGTDVETMRLPMQKLIAEKKVRTEGERRGTRYFAGAGKAKRAGRKAKPARRAKAAKRRKPVATVTLLPRPKSKVVKPAAATAGVGPVTAGAT